MAATLEQKQKYSDYWYKDHKSRITLHSKTQEIVDYILDKLKNKLDEVHNRGKE